MRFIRVLAILCASVALQSCGGGGGDDSGPDLGTGWQEGVFRASSNYEAKCAAPRSGNDPDGNPWPDVAGTAVDEKNWLRSWTHELYLWYDEVPDLDPATRTVADYFDLMKTSATTDSGQDKDKFHFTYPTDDWLALSESGETIGFGLLWALFNPDLANGPREVVVAFAESGYSGAVNGVMRGDRILAVDGVDIQDATNAGVDTLNAGLYPSEAGESHTFTIQPVGGGASHDVTLQSQSITSTPVQNVRVINSGGAKIGYLLFNDHIEPAEAQLVDAVQQLAAADIDDLVIDIRYNGGGYLSIASELAYMVAGSAATSGKTFEQLEFNDQYSDTNPVTGEPLDPVPFFSMGQGFSVDRSTALPTLNLSRVFVLTGEGTCSASESIINSLRGVDVEVIQIGTTTCGKPYGFYPADNCGTTYFSIQFKGVNAKGEGDYTDGFSPQNTASGAGESLPGCSVADDFEHALGAESEAVLAEALQYRTSGTCMATPASASGRVGAQSVSERKVTIAKSPWHQNRILQRPHDRR